MTDGRTTFPSYSANARKGVVAAGEYSLAKYTVFSQPIPPIELECCYNCQVQRHPAKGFSADYCRTRELVGIDSWLSLAGWLPEIADGRSNIIRTTPVLIEMLMADFEEDFWDVDLSATEGGFQLLQDMLANLQDVLEDEGLSQAEQLFVLVAMLRTAKRARCITLGTDTKSVEEVLYKDRQVYFV